MTRARQQALDDLVQALPRWQLAAMRFNDEVARVLGVASTDLQCLFALDRSGPATVGELGRQVGLTTGSTSRMVERLVRARLVTRAPDAADRRRAVVDIDAAASRRLHAIYDPLDARLREELERESDATLRRLLRFVDGAVALTHDQIGELGGPAA